MKKIIPLVAVIIIFAGCKKSSAPAHISYKSSTPLITDTNDPVTYTFIKIGSQKWMTANLDVTRYKNGDKIPQVKGKDAWAALTTGAWCWYNNDSATYAATYGKLYNWYAVNDPRGLAPTGWHIPTNIEWDTLSIHLGTNVGGKLKETGTLHWLTPNDKATNKSDFTALPGGYRYIDGLFNSIGRYGFWWSSTQFDAGNAWYRLLSYNNGDLYKNFQYKLYGFSVRCIKD